MREADRDPREPSTVHLPLNRRPQFPDRCVGCGHADGGTAVTLWSSTPWKGCFARLGRRPTRVPACAKCGWTIRAWRLVRAALFVAAMLGIALGVRKAMPDAPAAVTVSFLVLFIPLFMMLSFAFSGVWPPAVAISVRPDRVRYQFRDAAYAHTFAALNNAHVEQRRAPRLG